MKIVAEITYDGLGFPIKLQKVKMVKIDNEWHPQIDVRKVADAAIEALASQKQRLTGDQIKFIRTYFGMTLRDFAKKVVCESHTAVNKWEKFGSKPTNMDINIEKILRLYIHGQINKKSFYKKYKELDNIRRDSNKQKKIRPEIQISAA